MRRARIWRPEIRNALIGSQVGHRLLLACVRLLLVPRLLLVLWLRILRLLVLRLPVLGLLLILRLRVLWLLVLRLPIAVLRCRSRILPVTISIGLLSPSTCCAQCERTKSKSQRHYAMEANFDGRKTSRRRCKAGRPVNGLMHPGFHLASHFRLHPAGSTEGIMLWPPLWGRDDDSDPDSKE